MFLEKTLEKTTSDFLFSQSQLIQWNLQALTMETPDNDFKS